MTPLLAPPPTTPRLPAPTTAVQRFVLGTTPRDRTEVVIGAHDVCIDDHRVALDDIDAVAYSSRARHANLVQRRTRRRAWLRAGDRTLVLDLGTRAFGRQDRVREARAFDALVRLLHERVEPRLRRHRVTQLCAGAHLRLGALTLSEAGVTVVSPGGERSWPWRSIPVAELRGDHIALIGDDDELHARIDAMEPDAVMLPELLWSAAAALI